MAGPRPWQRVGDDVERYRGYLRVVRRTLRLPDGRESDWDLIDSVDSVVVLPLTADARVVCVRQYRPGQDRVVTSLPGGLLEDGEDAEGAARRELEEETGYRASRVQVIGHTGHYKSVERYWSSVAYDCEPTGVPQPDELELMEVVVLDVAEVRALLRDGAFGCTEQAYRALDHAGLL